MMKRIHSNRLSNLHLIALGALGACASGRSGGEVEVIFPALTKGSIEFSKKRIDDWRETASKLSSGVLQGELTEDDHVLGDGSFADVCIFEGKEGQLLRVHLDSDDFNALVMIMEKSEDVWTPIAFDDNSGDGWNARVEVELPMEGDYAVWVSTAGSTRTGEYTLRTETEDMLSMNRNGDPDLRYALLVGAGDYTAGTANDLPAVKTDLELMKRTLIDHLGFLEENILVLQDARATYGNIMRGFSWHLGQAGEKGVAFFYFSGHGLQLGDNVRDADRESDGRDEALCMADGRFLIDDELDDMALFGVNTNNLMMVIDSCHSGTAAMLAGDVRVKEISPEDLGPMLRKGNALTSTASNYPLEEAEMARSKHVLISSSRDFEPSLCAGSGVHLPGARTQEPASLFTYCFALAIELEGKNAKLETILETTYDAMGEFLQAVGSDQQPQIFGPRKSESLATFFDLS